MLGSFSYECKLYFTEIVVIFLLFYLVNIINILERNNGGKMIISIKFFTKEYELRFVRVK